MNTELARWVREQIDGDEKYAQAATDPDRPGTHWQWEDNETDEVIPDGRTWPAMYDEGRELSLRTWETFTSKYTQGELPAFIIYGVDDVPEAQGALDHIAEFDPARVLASVRSKRMLLSLALSSAVGYDDAVSDSILLRLAVDYVHRPGCPREVLEFAQVEEPGGG